MHSRHAAAEAAQQQTIILSWAVLFIRGNCQLFGAWQAMARTPSNFGLLEQTRLAFQLGGL